MGDFDGKVILVTGSATGLGAAIAVGAARRGAKAVILNCTKSRTEAEATAQTVRAAGAEVVALIRNRAHGEVNVVYRRADGNIGWVDAHAAKARA